MDRQAQARALGLRMYVLCDQRERSGLAKFNCLRLQGTENRRAGEKGDGESLGQLGGASLSNCRELRAEGGAARSLTATSQKTLLPVKTELSLREPMRTKRRGDGSYGR